MGKKRRKTDESDFEREVLENIGGSVAFVRSRKKGGELIESNDG